MTRLFSMVITLPLVLTACGSAQEPVPEPTPTATVAAPRTLIAADFDPATLGARIAGPQGAEVESTLTASGEEVGTMISYVACPEDAEICDPAQMPKDTLYTYVHRITLAEAPRTRESEEENAIADAIPNVDETGATLFRTTSAATGFNGAIGYSEDEAEAALGSREAITVSSDTGQLIWRVTSGEGWKPGGTITFYWKSTLPPGGPEEAYRLKVDDVSAEAAGPFPPQEAPEPAAN